MTSISAGSSTPFNTIVLGPETSGVTVQSISDTRLVLLQEETGWRTLIEGTGFGTDPDAAFDTGTVTRLQSIPPGALLRRSDVAADAISVTFTSFSAPAFKDALDTFADTGSTTELLQVFASVSPITFLRGIDRQNGFDTRTQFDLAAAGLDDVGRLMSGAGSDDRLLGGAGRDTLDGQGGADTLIGGDGNDVYVVSLSDYPDEVLPEIIETADGGRDSIRTNVSAVDLRGTNLESLVMSFGSDLPEGTILNGTGTDGANYMQVRSGTYELRGLAGNDFIVAATRAGSGLLDGGDGNDFLTAERARLAEQVTLLGGAGDDEIFGSPGADLIDGGSGDDSIDEVGENDTIDGGDGYDVLRLRRDDPMRHVDNVEEVFFLAPVPVFDTNGGGMVVRGWNGDTVYLTQRGAAPDTILGGFGDNTYVIRKTGVDIREGVTGGTDTILTVGVHTKMAAHVENLRMVEVGSSGTVGANVNARGNGSDNRIIGNSGDNVINGAGGSDTITGGDGTDTFVFNLADGRPDLITDFVSGEDRIALVGAGLSDITDADALVFAGDASNADYRLVFLEDTGRLFFDEDGGGTAQARHILTIQGDAITAEDLGLG